MREGWRVLVAVEPSKRPQGTPRQPLSTLRPRVKGGRHAFCAMRSYAAKWERLRV
jgi:hypothetical protein